VTRRGAAARVVAIAAVVGALAVSAAACGSSSKSNGSSGTNPPGNFSITLPRGQASLSLTGALPPGWPSTFPVPTGATVAGSGSLGGQEKTAHVAVYSTSQAAKDAYNFYAQNTQLHVSGARSAGAGNSFIGEMTLVSPYKGSLAVVGRNSTTYIVIELETAGASTASTTTTT
jgi:hypothetical protein